MTNEEAFCIGFAYGERYGYEPCDSNMEGIMSKDDIMSSSVIAEGLYKELYEENKDVETV